MKIILTKTLKMAQNKSERWDTTFDRCAPPSYNTNFMTVLDHFRLIFAIFNFFRPFLTIFRYSNDIDIFLSITHRHKKYFLMSTATFVPFFSIKYPLYDNFRLFLTILSHHQLLLAFFGHCNIRVENRYK